MPLPRLSLGLGLTLLALVACAPRRVTVVPAALQGFCPLGVQVDPHLFAVTERWASGGTVGNVAVGDWLRQVLVDDPQAPLRLTYVTSHLHVATVVSPVFYRPRAYEARYQLIVRVEAAATGVRQAWLHAGGRRRHHPGGAGALPARRHTEGGAWSTRGGSAQPPMTWLDRGARMSARVRKASRAVVCPGISCGSLVGYAASLGGIS